MPVRLRFDFPDADGRPQRLTFDAPAEILVAERLDDVLPVLHAVDRATRDGRWAAGFLAKEAAPAFEPRMRVHADPPLPLAWFGILDRPAEDRDDDGSPARPDDAWLRDLDWRLDTDREHHRAAVEEIRTAIAEGRTYQVNLTARLEAEAREPLPDPASTYEALRAAQGEGYHALLDLGRHVLLSASPELRTRRAPGRSPG